MTSVAVHRGIFELSDQLTKLSQMERQLAALTFRVETEKNEAARLLGDIIIVVIQSYGSFGQNNIERRNMSTTHYRWMYAEGTSAFPGFVDIIRRQWGISDWSFYVRTLRLLEERGKMRFVDQAGERSAALIEELSFEAKMLLCQPNTLPVSSG